MKIPTLFAAWTALAIMAMSLESERQEPDFKPPGTEENAAVDQANTRLDAVYKRLIGKLNESLREPSVRARATIAYRPYLLKESAGVCLAFRELEYEDQQAKSPLCRLEVRRCQSTRRSSRQS